MDRRWIFALLLPVVTTIAFWFALPPAYRVSESSDYDSFYGPVAHRLLEGHGLTLPDGTVALRYPPGYPVILAVAIGAGKIVGASEANSLKALTLVCVALSSLFLFLIAADLWGGWMALVPSAVWSTYPLALWLTKQSNSEVPFTALFFATVYVVWRLVRSPKPTIWLVAAAGILPGLAMLVRPIAIFLPVVLAVLVFQLGGAWPRAVRAVVAAVLLAVSAEVALPWALYASQAAGRPVLLSTGGVPSMRDGLTFGVNPDKSYRVGIYVPDFVRTVMIGFYAKYYQLDSYRAIARASADQVKEHPVGVAGLLGLKMFRAWYGTDSQRLDVYILILQLVYLGLLARAAWLARRSGGQRSRLWVLCVWVLGYFWSMSVAALPLVRYMLPAIGLAFLLSPVLFERRTA